MGFTVTAICEPLFVASDTLPRFTNEVYWAVADGGDSIPAHFITRPDVKPHHQGGYVMSVQAALEFVEWLANRKPDKEEKNWQAEGF